MALHWFGWARRGLNGWDRFFLFFDNCTQALLFDHVLLFSRDRSGLTSRQHAEHARQPTPDSANLRIGSFFFKRYPVKNLNGILWQY